MTDLDALCAEVDSHPGDGPADERMIRYSELRAARKERDLHAEGLRSIREMLKAETPDVARAIQWCSDSLSGYVEPVGVTQAKLQDQLVTAERERDEARALAEKACAQHNELLAQTRILTCAFCGETYPPGTPPTQHEALTAHVKACVKHPMREAERYANEQADIVAAEYNAVVERHVQNSYGYAWMILERAIVTLRDEVTRLGGDPEKLLDMIEDARVRIS